MVIEGMFVERVVERANAEELHTLDRPSKHVPVIPTRNQSALDWRMNWCTKKRAIFPGRYDYQPTGQFCRSALTEEDKICFRDVQLYEEPKSGDQKTIMIFRIILCGMLAAISGASGETLLEYRFDDSDSDHLTFVDSRGNGRESRFDDEVDQVDDNSFAEEFPF